MRQGHSEFQIIILSPQPPRPTFMKHFDFIIIGSGIIGASTAWQLLLKFPKSSILLIEKEHAPAQHQTGHNSGVIHAGVYYQPNSLKARLCFAGEKATKQFCKEHGIDFNQCGKLLVATNQLELERMQNLIERCKLNQLEFQVLSESELKEREPHISGLGAIFVPATSIVSWKEVCCKMLDLFTALGGKTLMQSEVSEITEHHDQVVVSTNNETFSTNYLIACAGLHSDRVARMAGLSPNFKIIPFRGEYYALPPDKNHLIQHLIYPIPDPNLPFLGVHLTRMIDGSITVGPSAVAALAREGYSWRHINLKDCLEIASNPAFWKVITKHWKASLNELRCSLSKKAYLDLVSKYCPQLSPDDLQPYPAGVRSQAVSSDGQLIDEFLFLNSQRMIHVCNTPSPAATSSIPIGEHIVKMVCQMTDSQN